MKKSKAHTRPAQAGSAVKAVSRRGEITGPTQRRLETLARLAAARSYAPYSHFAVGAAVLGDTGRCYSGANVENASFGLCNCAERTAIFSAISAGEREIRCVAIYTPTMTATAPCGACRQVINEFGPTARIVSVCDSADRIETLLDALLPGAFGPADLR